MEIRKLRTDTIKPYELNAKKHPQEQIEKIARSLREFGWQQPLVVDKDNVLVIGHGRLFAAKQLGMDTVSCVLAENLTSEQVNALRLADNKVSESEWDGEKLLRSLREIADIDMEDFGFDLGELDDLVDGMADESSENDGTWSGKRDNTSSMRYAAFENQEVMQFDTSANFYGFPTMTATQTTGDNFLRFCDWKECSDPENYIAHFYYDDFKFMMAWKEPDKYVERLRNFKAVRSPDLSLYTDFPKALQILSCYRRQWCGAYWQHLGLDVIPDVVWGEEDTFDWCFDGIPKHSTVAVSSVGVKNDEQWNGKEDSLFLKGYNAMMERLEPTTVLYYGDMIDGVSGNVIRIPSFYEQRRQQIGKK
jgi:hypothetical protein